jgi:polyisoprenoid-binding protein YceI
LTATITIATALPGWSVGTWTIDPAHSQVSFSVRHLMSKVRGTFDDFRGEIVTDADPTRSSVTAFLELASVNTGVETRDNHLRSKDFFDIEQSPMMTFTSNDLRREGEQWVLLGDLTIKGVTKDVELEIDYLGIDTTGMQGEQRIGFEARTLISRADFGISFGLVADGGKVMIGDRIDIVIEVEAVLAG